MTAQLSGDRSLGILLVDENRIFADVLAMRLREEPHVRHAVVAGSVSEALTTLGDQATDLVLVDYGPRGDPCLTLMTELSGAMSAQSVVVVSDVDDPGAVVAALEAGVRGWLTKDSTFASLWEAVEEVRLGRMVLSPSVVEPLVVQVLGLLRHQPPISRHDFVAELSVRELEVLRCLVAGLNKKEIAARLFLSVNTVRTHVQHLLRHADEHTTLALVAAARDLGVLGSEDVRVTTRVARLPRVQAREETTPDP